MAARLIMLGTGSAFPTHSYNSCFIIKSDHFTLLADAGGGNGIFERLERAGIAPAELTHFVISHTHTDHILGAVWIVRARINLAKSGKTLTPLHIYANEPTVSALIEICRLTFLDSYFSMIKDVTDIHVINPPSQIVVGNATVDFFDVMSENVKQLGFRLTFSDGRSIVSLGDEALTQQNREAAKNTDYLICGAFCRYADRDIFHPYEKHHLTVKDVAKTAQRCDIKHLILYHSEDSTIEKKEKYADEASAYFSGKVTIPADLDIIDL
ncbi:MAG: MBL fold metallo-hydrolase [Muribaculaceae bacterium]|nr:MBL fold metallo-hydrolase [Muribaculaceae bacterium]